MLGKTEVMHREWGGKRDRQAQQSSAGREMPTPCQAPSSLGRGEIGDSSHWAILSQEYTGVTQLTAVVWTGTLKRYSSCN